MHSRAAEAVSAREASAIALLAQRQEDRAALYQTLHERRARLVLGLGGTPLPPPALGGLSPRSPPPQLSVLRHQSLHPPLVSAAGEAASPGSSFGGVTQATAEQSAGRRELAAQAGSDVVVQKARDEVRAAERDLGAAELSLEIEQKKAQPAVDQRQQKAAKRALVLAQQAEGRAVAKAQRDMEARARARMEAARLAAMNENDRAMEQARLEVSNPHIILITLT